MQSTISGPPARNTPFGIGALTEALKYPVLQDSAKLEEIKQRFLETQAYLAKTTRSQFEFAYNLLAKDLLRPGEPMWQYNVQDWYDKLASESGKISYARKTRANISKMFRWAARAGLIAYNPIALLEDSDEAKHRGRSEAPREPVIIEPDEYRLLVATAEPALRSLIILSYNTSLAMADCCLLTWDHIEVDGNIIRYKRKKMERYGHWIEVPMNTQVVDLLVAQAAKRLKEGQYCYEYVFPEAAHNYNVRSCYYALIFGKLARRLGIHGKTFHCLRRSAISRWVSHPGADPFTVGSMSGHKQINTLQRYVKASMDKKRTLVDLEDKK